MLSDFPKNKILNAAIDKNKNFYQQSFITENKAILHKIDKNDYIEIHKEKRRKNVKKNLELLSIIGFCLSVTALAFFALFKANRLGKLLDNFCEEITLDNSKIRKTLSFIKNKLKIQSETIDVILNKNKNKIFVPKEALKHFSEYQKPMNKKNGIYGAHKITNAIKSFDASDIRIKDIKFNDKKEVIIEYFKLNEPNQNDKLTTSFTDGFKKEDIAHITELWDDQEGLEKLFAVLESLKNPQNKLHDFQSFLSEVSASNGKITKLKPLKNCGFSATVTTTMGEEIKYTIGLDKIIDDSKVKTLKDYCSENLKHPKSQIFIHLQDEAKGNFVKSVDDKNKVSGFHETISLLFDRYKNGEGVITEISSVANDKAIFEITYIPKGSTNKLVKTVYQDRELTEEEIQYIRRFISEDTLKRVPSNTKSGRLATLFNTYFPKREMITTHEALAKLSSNKDNFCSDKDIKEIAKKALERGCFFTVNGQEKIVGQQNGILFEAWGKKINNIFIVESFYPIYPGGREHTNFLKAIKNIPKNPDLLLGLSSTNIQDLGMLNSLKLGFQNDCKKLMTKLPGAFGATTLGYLVVDDYKFEKDYKKLQKLHIAV